MNPFSVLIKPDLNRPRPFHKVYDREGIPLPDVRPDQKLTLPPPTLNKELSASRRNLVSLLSETNDAKTAPQFLIPTPLSRSSSMRKARVSASSTRSSSPSPANSSSFRRKSAPIIKPSQSKPVIHGDSTPKSQQAAHAEKANGHLDAAQAIPSIANAPHTCSGDDTSPDSEHKPISSKTCEAETAEDIPEIVVNIPEACPDDVETKQQLVDSGVFPNPEISESSSMSLSSLDENSHGESNSVVDDSSHSQFSIYGDTDQEAFLPCFPSALLQKPAFSRSQSVSSQQSHKKTGQVHVHIVSASHLKPFGILRPKLHPFVRVVLGEGREARTCESRPQKGNSPAFHETMHFELGEDDFEARLLFFVANSEPDRQPIIGRCYLDVPTPDKVYSEEHAIFRDDKVTGYLKVEIHVFVDVPGLPSARNPDLNKNPSEVPPLSLWQLGAMSNLSELVIL